MTTALQTIVLAARAQGAWALDGVFNKLDDAEGLRQEAGEGLESVEPFDVYVGAPIPEGQRSVAVRLVFRGQRTLTDAEVDPVMDRLIGAVRAQGWTIREK